ncbi:MAG: hypothetical protein E4G91_02740, partial [Candidatus Zixiibacteriota bacterium]
MANRTMVGGTLGFWSRMSINGGSQMKHFYPLHFIRSSVMSIVIVFSLAGNSMSEENAISQTRISTTLDANERSQIVDAVIETLQKYYIYPDKADEMVGLLKRKLNAGEYDGFTNRDPFISELTRDLRSVTNDLHLGVWPIETSLTLGEISEEERQKETVRKRYENYGIPTAKRLQGNIGYLEIMDFEASEQAGAAAVSGMNFLANCDAIIIDLRRCGGGEGPNGLLILSYFFREPVHLNSAYTRYTDVTEQIWTLPYVPGPTMPDIPVYVLQSRRTASAAEGMVYSLKTRRRATIVGEKTRGAANMIDEINFPELSISVAVSISRVFNPITGTSWEGVGIEPDIDIPAEKALQAACRHAADKLLQSEKDGDIRRRRQWALDLYEAELNPTEIDDASIRQLCGKYS